MEPSLANDSELNALRNGASLIALLSKTKLSLEGDALVKREGGDVVGRHSLASIVRIGLVQRTDPFGVAFTVGMLIGAIAMKFLVPDPTWSWTGFVVLALGGLLLMGGIKSTVLTVATKHGDVGYPIIDPLDQAEAFVVTVREQLARNPEAQP